ncbi:MAG: BON domain-containing protein [Acetobacterales bacterium]
MHRPDSVATLRRCAALLLLAALTLPAAGCTPLGFAAGAGATAGTAAMQERGIGGAASDTAVYARVNKLLLDDDLSLYSKVGIEVQEGRVLLTGSVGDPEARIRAVRLAWQAEGVKEVINEIAIGSRDSGNRVRDAWITTQLSSRLLFDKEISSINYNVDTAGGVVYLMGVAQDQRELDRVMRHARDVKYVQRVVNYVRLKSDPRRPQ